LAMGLEVEVEEEEDVMLWCVVDGTHEESAL